PQKGEIFFDDTDIRHIGLKYYRQNIAVVMQDDALFSGTIKDNIGMFDPEANDDDVRKCARDAGILEDILTMPMGFASLVGDMGSSLSGGQKQRLLVARALYKQPRVLFMDEATSHLDPVTERKVNKAIRKSGITRIIIAHREETILLADRVIEIDKLGQAVISNHQQIHQPS
ncbi:MAG TPA: ATP-binding cassette domain-containing protein, partial [Gammaproteobacteria bacterium]